jgi:hypothetical protein
MMMEGNRNLYQPLKEPLFWTVRFPPHIFPNFVCIKEMTLVEELNSALISVQVHAQILPTAKPQKQRKHFRFPPALGLDIAAALGSL